MTLPGCNAGRGSKTSTSRLFVTRLLATVALAGVSALAAGNVRPAMAQETTSRLGAARDFNIPAQPLASALNSFGRQSGLQVTLAASTSRGVTASAVRGSLTPQQALSQLLSGTGISFRITGDGTAVVGASPSAAATGGDVVTDGSTVLKPIQVHGTGTSGDGIGEVSVTAEDLERANPTNIADVFRAEPGIAVGSSLPASQKVYVHGVEETNLAVSIDGSRQNNKVFHHSATNLIDPSLLKAVDVDAGIAPADAGPGALAGAINYETKDVRDLLTEDGFGGSVTSSYNFNSHTLTTGASVYGMQDGFEMLGAFSFGRGDEFTAGNGDLVNGTATDFLSGLGKVAYESDSGDRVELSHERVHDAAARPFRANVGFIDGRPAWEPRVRDYRLDRQNTVFTYTDSTPEGWWDPKLVLAYSRNTVDTLGYACPGRGCTVPVTYPTIGETDSFNGRFENKFDVGMGSITAGVDFYNDSVNLDAESVALAFSDSAREKASNVGIYAQARLEPWERTRLSFGGRADHQWFTGVDDSDWSNSGLSGNISGEYDITDFLTAKAGYAHSWGGIPLAESFIMNPAWTYGDGPEPVSADNYLIGLEAKYAGFTVEGSLFRTDIEDARIARYSPAATGGLIARDLESRGFEIGAGYAWLDGYIKVKYAHIDVDVDGAPADSDTGNYLAAPVGDIITITGAHTFEDWGLTIGGDIEIAPEYDRVAANTPAYKAYEVVNIFAEYKPASLSHFTFRADVKNLFDETYAERATYGQEFGTVTPLYEAGRTFLLTAKATF